MTVASAASGNRLSGARRTDRFYEQFGISRQKPVGSIGPSGAYLHQVLYGLLRTIAGRRDGEIRGATIHRVVGYLRPHKLAVAAALACLLAQAVLALAPFVIVRRLIADLEHPNGSFSTIVLLVFAGLGLVLVAGLVYVLRSWIVLRITAGVVADLRRQVI
jgi:ABC-type bacteriocin/lantibiotic exporter with double-glycine peptidase domain